MGLRRRHRVQRAADGTYRLDLPEPERDLVANLVDQLRSLLLDDTDDPTVRRLFPTAYNQDAERDREYQQLVRDELLDHRLTALDTVTESIDAESLPEDSLNAWVSAVNDLRLVLGTRLDVSEEGPTHLMEGPVDPDDPEVLAYSVYEYLGFLLSEAIDALSEGLPTDRSDDPGI